MLVALTDLAAGEPVPLAGVPHTPLTSIPAKHKLASVDLPAGAAIVMYGVMVARAREPIARGGLLTTRNVQHEASPYTRGSTGPVTWTPPEVARWQARTFDGFLREDGRVGTRNYWLVIPLVFCENRNVDALREAFEEELGYGRARPYRSRVRALVDRYNRRDAVMSQSTPPPQSRIFPNIDGIRFLTHAGGCGETRQDTQALCGLLAGYIQHPNVAGATVLSLGCQHAQSELLLSELHRRNPHSTKPLLLFDQQQTGLESTMLSAAIDATFAALAEADRSTRQPAPIAKLTVGLKCGGSDGFSGISANPALGHVADVLSALGASSILAEFPELHGVEQNLINRCAGPAEADRFMQLMHDYNARAKAVHSGFEMNPSPGNVQDGLLTDAMKSAGAARKGGSSPVRAVLDYPETVTRPGLNLLCTPGSDVECVTAQAGAGANLVLFTTGLGTPTGNPVAPVLKLSSNTRLAERMADLIDIDTGSIIRGETTVEQMGDAVLDAMLDVASGRTLTKAELLGQNDFIPWKRGVSL